MAALWWRCGRRPSESLRSPCRSRSPSGTGRRTAAVELWSRRLATPALAGPIQWAAKAQTGLLHWRWMEADAAGAWSVREGMVWIDAARGAARELDTQIGDTVCLSPTRTGGGLRAATRGCRFSLVRVIAPDGSVSPPMTVPAGAYQRGPRRWQPDGKNFYLELSVPLPAPEKKDVSKADAQGAGAPAPPEQAQGFGAPSRSQWFAVELAPPHLVALDREPADALPAVNPGAPPSPLPRAGADALHIASAPAVLKQGAVETPLHPLWLETGGAKPMAALLCADGERAQLAPAGDAALFLAQGRVWVTTLQRLPRPLFLASILTAHQDDVKSRAWTLAQAVRMWSGAHAGTLPGPKRPWPLCSR